MAFSFDELNRIKENISNDSEELNSTLKELDNLIKSNIGNVDVWDSQKATEFLNNWNDFSNEKFPVFEQSFKSQINILDTAIKSYKEAETDNTTTSQKSTTPTKSNYENQIEKVSESNNEKPIIVNQETTHQAIEENLKNNKDLSKMFNEELYNSFKETLTTGGIVAGATKIQD